MLPALRWQWLSRFYPRAADWLGLKKLHAGMLPAAGLGPRARVLDLGCGPGTFLAELRQSGAQSYGLDADGRILRLAAAHREALPGVMQGLAQELPFAAGSFDAVFSTLLFHHLRREDKLAALAECRRVLKPQGRLYLADWTRPHTRRGRCAFLLVRLFDGFERTSDHARGRLPELIRAAGFHSVHETSRRRTPLGTIGVYEAKRDVERPSFGRKTSLEYL